MLYRKIFILIISCMFLVSCGRTHDKVEKITQELEYHTKRKIYNWGNNMQRQLAMKPERRLLMAIDSGNRDMWDMVVAENAIPDQNKIVKYAYDENKYAMIYYIIGNGIDVNLADDEGNCFFETLFSPTECRSKVIYNKLLENGFNINSKNIDGYTVLEQHFLANEIYYSEWEDLVAVQYYVEHGADLRENLLDILCRKQYVNYASLHFVEKIFREKFKNIKPDSCIKATLLGDSNYVKENFKSEQRTDDETKQLIFYTAALGTKENLDEMLTYTKCSPDIQDGKHQCLVMAAAAGGNLETFQFLMKNSSYIESEFKTDKYETSFRESLLTCALAGRESEIINDVCEDSSIFPGGIYGENLQEFPGDSIASFGDLELVKKFIKARDWDADTIERILQYVGWERGKDFFIQIWNMKEINKIKSDQEKLIQLLSSGISADTVKFILSSLNQEKKRGMLKALRCTYNTRESNCIVDMCPYIEVYHDCGMDFREDSSIVYAAVRNGEVKALKLLLQYGANCSDLDLEFEDETPLIKAAHVGDITITRILLENGADPNMMNSKGETALMYAIGSVTGSAECAGLLLQYGADVSAKTADGDSCLDLAREWGDKETISIIKDAVEAAKLE